MGRDALSLLRKAGFLAGWRMSRLGAGGGRAELLFERERGTYRETVHAVRGPAYIEPEFGWVITEEGELIEESMTPQFPMPKATWRNGLPSPARFREAIRDPSRIEEVESVVSLRHFWEWNYYHFHLDVLGKLKLLADAGVSDELPLALGRYARELRFARELLGSGRLAHRRWMVPDLENRRIIRAGRVLFCRAGGEYRERVLHLLSCLDLPAADPAASGRVWLHRAPPAFRTIANWEEIRPIIEEHGFRIVDSAQLGIAEQIDLFRSTRYLAGVHGAGMTNMIYRAGVPLSLLELYAHPYVSVDMQGLCAELGYDYARLGCKPAQRATAQHANLAVEPEALRQALQRMLNPAACEAAKQAAAERERVSWRQLLAQSWPLRLSREREPEQG
jgi:Glycosyltransferase 61